MILYIGEISIILLLLIIIIIIFTFSDLQEATEGTVQLLDPVAATTAAAAAAVAPLIQPLLQPEIILLLGPPHPGLCLRMSLIDI